ncbi:unnamed protein product [Ascophyllum nodosum]
MLVPWSIFFCIARFWPLAAFGDASSLPSDQFETLSYGRIVLEAKALAKDYPHLAQVYSAQDRYNLPSPGPCSKDGSVMCEQWVLHVSDHASLPEDVERPEVFLSGCLHGDEQVGPNAVLEAAKIMVYAAVCQADGSAKECDYEAFRGAPASVPWLARLALTRSTVVMPMANPIGYYKVVRTENHLDPNRDFPYQQDASRCMTTIAARAVNEVWRDHIFQLAVTFHGGMVAMAYEWGSPNHRNKKNPDGSWQDVSPDHGAQEVVTEGLSRFAGSFKAKGKTFGAYPSGRMNELVYAVPGGMEDWAYAGSWDEGVTVCKPKTYGGYPEEKTVYNSATLRALNILVETSVQKLPSKSLLGSRTGLLEDAPRTEEHTNGHVARNVRLSLALVDLVQPYVEWKPSEAFQALETGNISNKSDARARVGGVVTVDGAGGVDLEWTVGGGFQVDATRLVWGAWPPNADSLSLIAWEGVVAAASDAGSHSPAQRGSARWGTAGDVGGKTIFRERVELGSPRPGSRTEAGGDGDGGGGFASESEAAATFVVAVAKVDQSWANQSLKPSPDVGPQSHFVNARTSEDWFHESAGHVVRGRVTYLSRPLKVLRASPSSPPSAPSETIEQRVSRVYSNSSNATSPSPSMPASVLLRTGHGDAANRGWGGRLVSIVIVILGLGVGVWLIATVVEAARECWGYPLSWPAKTRRSRDSAQRPAIDSAVELCARSDAGDLSRRRNHESLVSSIGRERGSAEREGLLNDDSCEVDDRP